MNMKKIPDYKQMIIELIEKIDDEKFLRRIYISLKEYLKERKSD